MRPPEKALPSHLAQSSLASHGFPAGTLLPVTSKGSFGYNGSNLKWALQAALACWGCRGKGLPRGLRRSGTLPRAVAAPAAAPAAASKPLPGLAGAHGRTAVAGRGLGGWQVDKLARLVKLLPAGGKAAGRSDGAGRRAGRRDGSAVCRAVPSVESGAAGQGMPSHAREQAAQQARVPGGLQAHLKGMKSIPIMKGCSTSGTRTPSGVW